MANEEAASPRPGLRVTKEQLEYLLATEPQLSDLLETSYDSPFLRLIVSAEREQLAQSFIERFYQPGEIIFREGDEGDTMFMIHSGKVVILKGDLDSPSILAYRSVGQIIGEMALLENRPRSATVIALHPTRLLGLDRQRFRQLLSEMPSVSLGIMEMLSAQLRQLSQVHSSGESSEKRLIQKVSALEGEKHRLEELQRFRQETSELVIHDLRNPLASIAVSLKMLTLVLPEESVSANQELFEIMQTSLERMQRLVDSLLEVARIESGEAQFHWSEVDLGHMIREVVARVSILDRKGIDLQTLIPAALPGIHADRDKIERVLNNLMDNALVYTPENGFIIFTVEARSEPGVGDVLQVSVSDEGPGIPPEDRQRIFERFSQGPGEKRGRRGFGLGLAYCRLAIEGHGGRIWVEPGEQGGSRFVFTLPLHPPGDSEAQ